MAMAADVKLIIDTDAGFDVDDIHALAVAHNLEKQGRVDSLATVTSTAYQYSIAGVNVINTYYGRGDIPLGAYKGPFGWEEHGQNTYLKDLVDNFPNGGIKTRDDVPDVLDTYVKVLNEAEDSSVTIACIGFPMNIRNLLHYHHDLFEQKVKEVHYMNGMYNFGCAQAFYLGDVTDCYGAAQKVQIDFPHTVREYFQGNGSDMCTGGPFWDDSCGDDKNPMKRAHKDWMNQRHDTCWPARPSWDPVTVYHAIVGTEEATMEAIPGTDEIDEKGRENFDKGWTSNNEFNLIIGNDKKQGVVDKINAMLCQGNNFEPKEE